MASPKNAVQKPALGLGRRGGACLRSQPLAEHPHQPDHIVVRHKVVAQGQARTGMDRIGSALVYSRPPARLEPVRPRQQTQNAVMEEEVKLKKQTKR